MKTLRNKEIKKLITEVKELFNVELAKKDRYEIDDNIILINNEAMFFYFKEKLVPSLKLLLKNNFLKKITVDMGAIPYAVKGADMMRPGVTDVDVEIKKEEIISIIDETHSKPVMVGVTLFSGEEIKKMNSGKVVKNIHHIGDNIWNY